VRRRQRAKAGTEGEQREKGGTEGQQGEKAGTEGQQREKAGSKGKGGHKGAAKAEGGHRRVAGTMWHYLALSQHKHSTLQHYLRKKTGFKIMICHRYRTPNTTTTSSPGKTSLQGSAADAVAFKFPESVGKPESDSNGFGMTTA
jgi:hypothetical protein